MRQVIKRFVLRSVFIGIVSTPLMAQTPRGMGPNATPRNWDNFEIASPEHVAGNIYRVVGGVIVNLAFSVGDDGIILVDSNFKELTGKIINAIQEVSDKPIRFLIDTHSHADHADGNVNFGRLGTIIVAHNAVRPRLEKPLRGTPASETALPVISFSNSMSFYLNNEEIEAFHIAAGHTDEDVMIYFKGSDVIHMGDVFVGQYPIIDPSRNGNLLGLIESLTATITRIGPDTKIIPGHGQIADRNRLVEYRDMLRDIFDQVSVLVSNGKTLEQVIAAAPTAQYDEKWAGPRGSRGIITAAYNAIVDH